MEGEREEPVYVQALLSRAPTISTSRGDTGVVTRTGRAIAGWGRTEGTWWRRAGIIYSPRGWGR